MPCTSWICSRCIWRSIRLTQINRSPRWIFYSTASEIGLSPVILTRARVVAEEYAALSAKLDVSFELKTAERVAEIVHVTNALQEWDKANASILELNSLLEDTSIDAELRELASEDLVRATSSLPILSEKLKHALIPRHPFAKLPCLLEIRPGAGGDEAGLFAFELLRMYSAFCSRRGLRTNILKRETEEGAGGPTSEERLTEAVIEVESPGSYDILRSEAGVHRVQRIPATESKGRTHTSAVSVMVLPSFPTTGSKEDNHLNFDDPNSDYYVDPQEVHTEKMRASGAGGQHVNKTESAIRLTHMPTGTVVSMRDSRSQHENRKKAWQLLRAKLAQARRDAREEEMVEMRRGVMGGVSKMGRGDKVRTYNWGQSRCTDHRSGMTVYNLGNVLDGGGGLTKIMESVRSWLVDREIDALFGKQATVSSGSCSGRKVKNKS